MKEKIMGIAPRYMRMEYCTPLSQTSTNIVSGIVKLSDRVASRDEVRKQPLQKKVDTVTFTIVLITFFAGDRVKNFNHTHHSHNNSDNTVPTKPLMAM